MPNEVQRLTPLYDSEVLPPTAGQYQLVFDGETTAAIDFDASAATIQAALEALATIGSGNVEVSGTLVDSPYTPTIEYVGALAHTDVPQVSVVESDLEAPDPEFAPGTSVTTQGEDPRQAVIEITRDSGVNGGTWTTGSGFGGPFAWNISAEDLFTAFETAAPGLCESVTPITDGWRVTYVPGFAGGLLLVDGSALEGGDISEQQIETMSEGAAEVWSINLDGATAGTWGLFGSDTDLGYDVNAAAVESYIETHASQGCSVTGENGAFEVTFDDLGEVDDPAFAHDLTLTPVAVTLTPSTLVEGSEATLPTVALSASTTSIVENGGTATLLATLSETAAETVVVGLAFAGTATHETDYSRSGASISIASGSLTGFISLLSLSDGVYEGSETIEVSIDDAEGADPSEFSTATVTIVDAQGPPQLTLARSPARISQGEQGTVFALLSHPAASNSLVTLAFSGAAFDNGRFTASSDSIALLAGETSGSITIDALTEPAYEGNETLLVTIDDIDGPAEEVGTQQATMKIRGSIPSSQTSALLLLLAE